MGQLVPALSRKLHAQGSIAWDGGGEFDVMLCSSAYVPSDADTYAATPAAHELTDGSYARVATTGRSVSSAAECKADNAVFPLLGGSTAVAWAVVIKKVTNDADSPIVAVCACVGTPDGADFTVDWDGAGIVYSLDAA